MDGTRWVLIIGVILFIIGGISIWYYQQQVGTLTGTERDTAMDRLVLSIISTVSILVYTIIGWKIADAYMLPAMNIVPYVSRNIIVGLSYTLSAVGTYYSWTLYQKYKISKNTEDRDNWYISTGMTILSYLWLGLVFVIALGGPSLQETSEFSSTLLTDTESAKINQQRSTVVDPLYKVISQPSVHHTNLA